jgi:hypothetical protein
VDLPPAGGAVIATADVKDMQRLTGAAAGVVVADIG